MITVECFKGIPIDYETFLIERYSSFITTCRYIEVNYATYDINYIVVYKDSILTELVIFGIKNGTATCFNSLVEIDQPILTECTKKIFENYPSIKKIKIVASYKEYSLKKAILYTKTDDNILTLPQTMAAFLSELGSSTRQHIRSRRSKLLRDYPTINFVSKFGVEIEESVTDKIIQLNSDRMKHKGIVPGINDTNKKNIFKYSQHYGCVVYLELDGLIIAGCIATVLKNEMFLHVFAHDNNFSQYNIGEACVCYLVQTTIEKGMPTFHFLWGESEFKKRLLAKPFPLFSYIIFRNYSINYLFSEVSFLFSTFKNRFMHSELSKPLKKAIKYYRKSRWKVQ